MVFAIRDDDTSYFTKPEELENAYSGLKEIPVTLSVIPNAVPVHGDTAPYGTGPFDRECGLVGDNQELVEYICQQEKCGRYEVVMHGIQHKYYMIDGTWIPEMCVLNYEQLKREFPKALHHLETVFNCNIDTFAPPSDSLNKDAFRYLDEQGINTMCLLSKRIDHPISPQYLKYYIMRNIRRALHRQEYTEVMRYCNHKELPVWPLESFEKLWSVYLSLKETNVPLIIYTHYWELNQDFAKKELLERIVRAMIEDGAVAEFVSKCFKLPMTN